MGMFEKLYNIKFTRKTILGKRMFTRYIITIDMLFLGLSIAGVAILFGILGPIVILSLVILLINVLQAKKPQWLPKMLTNWNFLPLWMHSFDPIDKVKICVKLMMSYQYNIELSRIG